MYSSRQNPPYYFSVFLKLATNENAIILNSLAYCTLGEAVDLERMLTGEHLPCFAQLGTLLFHMATSEAIDPAAMVEREDGCGYLGELSAFHVWLIYKPELAFLKSRDSALTPPKRVNLPPRNRRASATSSSPPPSSCRKKCSTKKRGW